VMGVWFIDKMAAGTPENHEYCVTTDVHYKPLASKVYTEAPTVDIFADAVF
jgi:hypothetical protein